MLHTREEVEVDFPGLGFPWVLGQQGWVIRFEPFSLAFGCRFTRKGLRMGWGGGWIVFASVGLGVGAVEYVPACGSGGEGEGDVAVW